MLSDLIREAREAKGWSQGELAKRVGVTRAAVSRWELDETAPTRHRAPRVAEALGIPLNTISPYGQVEPNDAVEDGRKSNVSAYDVGQRFAQLRKIMELDQIPFGEKAGLSQSRLSGYERGARMLTVRAALALCETYRVTMDWLFRGDASGLPYWMHQKVKDQP